MGEVLPFFIQNLTDGGSLQQVDASTTLTSLFDSSADFTIGSVIGGTRLMDGLFDEVRLSDIRLEAEGLLISVPEPSSFALAALGLLGLRRRRRK